MKLETSSESALPLCVCVYSVLNLLSHRERVSLRSGPLSKVQLMTWTQGLGFWVLVHANFTDNELYWLTECEINIVDLIPFLEQY